MNNKEFNLDDQTKNTIIEISKAYPIKRAALLPALNLVQEKFGFISEEAEKEVAELLQIQPIQVKEVVSFYSLLYDKPVGKNKIYICDNLTCHIEGSLKLIQHLFNKLKIGFNMTTRDGKWSLFKSPCLGACEKAPVVIINGIYYYNVSIELIDKLMFDLDSH